jgi:hypothetical protein
MGFFQRLRRQFASSSLPPAYEEANKDSTKSATAPKQKVAIKASDVPQWGWSNSKCRE